MSLGAINTVKELAVSYQPLLLALVTFPDGSQQGYCTHDLRQIQAITGATNASPIVITCHAHGLSNGQTVQIDRVAGNWAANGAWVVAGVTTNTFALVSSTGNGAYTS